MNGYNEGEGMSTESNRRAVAKYDATHSRVITLKFNLKTDADILEKLNSIENRQGYIKRLIREDIERSQ